MSKSKKKNDFINLDFKSISDDDMYFLRIEIEKEFKKRKIIFSVGEMGETFAIKHFNSTPGLDNLQRAPIGTKNVDALSRKGERYSIKTIKEGSKTGTVYPDENDMQLFEYILLVLLDDDFEMMALYRFSWKKFTEMRQWDKTMKAWYIPKTKKALTQAECIYEKRGK